MQCAQFSKYNCEQGYYKCKYIKINVNYIIIQCKDHILIVYIRIYVHILQFAASLPGNHTLHIPDPIHLRPFSTNLLYPPLYLSVLSSASLSQPVTSCLYFPLHLSFYPSDLTYFVLGRLYFYMIYWPTRSKLSQIINQYGILVQRASNGCSTALYHNQDLVATTSLLYIVIFCLVSRNTF